MKKYNTNLLSMNRPKITMMTFRRICCKIPLLIEISKQVRNQKEEKNKVKEMQKKQIIKIDNHNKIKIRKLRLILELMRLQNGVKKAPKLMMRIRKMISMNNHRININIVAQKNKQLAKEYNRS